MKLILSNEIEKILVEELNCANENITILTAFCKKEVLEFIDKNILKQDIQKRICVRFQLNDILYGATDIAICEYCKNNNWQLYIKLNLHAKVYAFDNLKGIVGSANMTMSGFGIGTYRNLELSTIVNFEENDLNKIDRIFLESTEMTDELYLQMLQQFKSISAESNRRDVHWNSIITSCLNNKITILFEDDLPRTRAENFNQSCAQSFLGLSKEVTDIVFLKSTFMKSNVYHWLINILENERYNEIYMGKLTVYLHNSLIRNPKKYRKDIKILIQNLISWIEFLKIDEIEIDRPNYSQRIKLIRTFSLV